MIEEYCGQEFYLLKNQHKKIYIISHVSRTTFKLTYICFAKAHIFIFLVSMYTGTFRSILFYNSFAWRFNTYILTYLFWPQRLVWCRYYKEMSETNLESKKKAVIVCGNLSQYEYLNAALYFFCENSIILDLNFKKRILSK